MYCYKCKYNEEDGVFWQIGISYCENPADEKYETLGIFVPAAYMDYTENDDGTYTCTINAENTVGDYTAKSAPIVIPVNTPGYSAMSAPEDYVSGAAKYTNAGFVYVNAGCRGREAGAPAGVTDLKAAVRYIRYTGGTIPGSSDRIFTFGMSGGGAQSALMGTTGNSSDYDPYLEAIGAVMGESDAVTGSMCWCPITSLDMADEAYEWNMGCTRNDLDEQTQALSDGMAASFAEYINELGLKDGNGDTLILTESESGIYQSGSYYDYIKSEIERSLNNFLSDTEFPFTSSSGGMGGHFGGMRGEHDGKPPKGELPDGERPDGFEGLPDREINGYVQDGEIIEDGVVRNGPSAAGASETYETVEDYIAALNSDTEWVIYDKETNTATVTSIEDFVKACKNAGKSVGAFDDLNRSQAENTLFGYDGEGAHFDSVMAGLLEDTEYAEDYAEDIAKLDFLGNTVQSRVNMYNPMYYLCDYYDGYKTSDAAQYWRIRTGIEQSDTALTTEINLALALENYGGLSVDFETVWEQAHTQAERVGSSTDNFINWVNKCLNG